ncbi:MAG: 4-hydroxy-tetrahydrodipicolinate reductase, partial [Firmicutes bacterium]|nr:4-hydroxy-tetrahydrodipicolinate reductase [Bacillota bacterium]
MNVAILGAGAMGNVLAQTVREQGGQVAGMVEARNGETLAALEGPVDVVIDFSNPANLDMLIDYCVTNSCPAVIATTGFTDEQKALIAGLSRRVPVVFAANFSLGITVMRRVLAEITPILENTFDMEVIEKHHNKKLDSPSGTAKMLVAAMNPDHVYEEVNGREGNRKRGKEIGIHAVRGGTIAGEHEVIFAGEDEILEIKHTAGSKKIFAAGAVTAARFVQTAEPGLYDMENVLFG